MRILYLTFYFNPDLGPGAFRNSSLVDELGRQLAADDQLHVITTQPNRYKSFTPLAFNYEERYGEGCRIMIERVAVPPHASGMIDQAYSFWTYFRAAHRLTQKREYDLVVASSSRLFTAFLGARLARRKGIRLILDIRDIFREAIRDAHPNLLLWFLLNPVLSVVERYTFGYARHINLVSEAFRSYFTSFPQATYSFFTNAIDEEFLTNPTNRPKSGSYPKTLLYAGNIGEGQALHTIIPQAAHQLGDGYRFVVIGDGGARQKLEKAIQDMGVTNVEVLPAISRQELLIRYQQADYLFMHLNESKACERVLPSKLFEYGATDKPIVAGVMGYAASFIHKHLDNSLVFSPGDVTDLVKQVRQTPYRTQIRTNFRDQFQRKTISRALARQLLDIATDPAQKSELIDVNGLATQTL